MRGNQVEGKASLSISQPVSHLAASLDNAKLVVATETVMTGRIVCVFHVVFILGFYIYR